MKTKMKTITLLSLCTILSSDVYASLVVRENEQVLPNGDTRQVTRRYTESQRETFELHRNFPNLIRMTTTHENVTLDENGQVHTELALREISESLFRNRNDFSKTYASEFPVTFTTSSNTSYGTVTATRHAMQTVGESTDATGIPQTFYFFTTRAGDVLYTCTLKAKGIPSIVDVKVIKHLKYPSPVFNKIAGGLAGIIYGGSLVYGSRFEPLSFSTATIVASGILLADGCNDYFVKNKPLYQPRKRNLADKRKAKTVIIDKGESPFFQICAGLTGITLGAHTLYNCYFDTCLSPVVREREPYLSYVCNTPVATSLLSGGIVSLAHGCYEYFVKSRPLFDNTSVTTVVKK